MSLPAKSPTKVTRERSRARRGADVPVPRDLIAHQVAGHLALDFCNTVGEHLASRPDESLRDWESFLRWATQVGLIGSESYVELLRYPESVSIILQLREAIYRIGLSIVNGRPLPERDLALILKEVSARRPRVEFRKNRLYWRPTPSRASSQLCAVLASEALSLLCSPKVQRIGICEGGNCGWLFIDESRGKKRRWCDMNDCGSRAKARRYYDKHRDS